jgi:hypothetical protein
MKKAFASHVYHTVVQENPKTIQGLGTGRSKTKMKDKRDPNTNFQETPESQTSGMIMTAVMVMIKTSNFGITNVFVPGGVIDNSFSYNVTTNKPKE